MRQPRFTLWFIIFLTIASIIIQLPFLKNLHFREGLDLAGGTSITLKADMQKIPLDQRDTALDSAKSVIERRVNVIGVSEPVIQTARAQDYRIIVELPGIPLQEAMNLVGKTGKLEFREVLKATTSAVLFEDTKETGLTGADLKDATPAFDSQTGQPIVSFRVADQSQDKFAKVTQNLIGKQMAIYLDKQFISDPTVQASIRDSGQITGGFTTDATKELSFLPFEECYR